MLAGRLWSRSPSIGISIISAAGVAGLSPTFGAGMNRIAGAGACGGGAPDFSKIRAQRCRLPTQIPRRGRYTYWVRPRRGQPAISFYGAFRLRFPPLSYWIRYHHRASIRKAEEQDWRDAYPDPGQLRPAINSEA